MKESETFDDFNTKFSKIVSTCFNLGEPIPQHKVVKKILRSLLERFRPKVVAIEENKDLNSLLVEELVRNLQTFEAVHCQVKKGKDIALISSSSMDDHDTCNPDSDTDDEHFEAYLARKLQKIWINRKNFNKKDSSNSKPPYSSNSKPPFTSNSKPHFKGKFVSKTEQNYSKGTTKPIKCFECQGYGHTASKCANRKEKNRSKALNVAWDENSDEDVSEPDSPSSKSGKFITFMALLNISSVQESKSEDDLDINQISDEEQEGDEAYQKLLLESMRMSKISEKRALKLKAMEEKNSLLQTSLTDSQSKVRQLEDQRAILSDKLILAGQENNCLQQKYQKSETELIKLQMS